MLIVDRCTVLLPVLDYLVFTVSTVYYCGNILIYKRFFPGVFSWAPVHSGSNRKWIDKEVDCWFVSVYIIF